MNTEVKEKRKGMKNKNKKKKKIYPDIQQCLRGYEDRWV